MVDSLNLPVQLYLSKEKFYFPNTDGILELPSLNRALPDADFWGSTTSASLPPSSISCPTATSPSWRVHPPAHLQLPPSSPTFLSVSSRHSQNPRIYNTPQIVHKVAICPRGNLPNIQITFIVLPYSQSTNYLQGVPRLVLQL